MLWMACLHRGQDGFLLAQRTMQPRQNRCAQGVTEAISPGMSRQMGQFHSLSMAMLACCSRAGDSGRSLWLA